MKKNFISKSFYSILLLGLLALNITDINSQSACKFTFCSCCADSGLSYNIYAVVGDVYVTTINTTADGCSLDSAINLSVGVSYYVTENNPSCDQIRYVYFTACICNDEGWMQIFLPCCMGDSPNDNQGKINNMIPGKCLLNQNYPNPFNPVTKLSFELSESSYVKLSVYDAAGRLVDIPLEKELNVGYHEVIWNSDRLNLSSGIYFYKIQAGSFTDEKKMILIK